jgi:hypothetical protein
MNLIPPNPNTPLIQSVSQFEVDFVIPRVGIDLPIGIDPFLLFKSRDPTLSALHTTILKAFNYGIELVHNNKMDDARSLFRFPEVAEIGLGYTKKGKRGAGVGPYLTEIIIETLSDSPALRERGVRHIEEMQLVSLGIGPDRVSDITANLLKQYLIEYTQKQCRLWDIPLNADVPVEHIFDPNTASWHDGYFDLPISPYDGAPILFVPRRIVRVLPWINYEDFFRMEFAAYLRAKRVKGRFAARKRTDAARPKLEKPKVVALARTEVERVDRYVSVKEATASEAQPSLDYVDPQNIPAEIELLKEKLNQLDPGNEHASEYQCLILEILNFLFSPQLIDGEMEVRTVDGTERRDIIFTNDSDESFWTYLRTEHSGIFLMFETKNTTNVENTHLNQTATYLGERLGRIGFIVTRNPLQKPQERKAFSIYNDSSPRKIILTLSDLDMQIMLEIKGAGNNPMRHIQKLYRSFRTRVQ